MDDINELETMVVNLFDCVKNLNVTASKLFANQQIFMKKQDLILKKIESLYPRVQEQEYQLEELLNISLFRYNMRYITKDKTIFTLRKRNN